jgi:predicted nucleic acid-binding protein
LDSYTLDACAVIALLNKEDGGEIVNDLFQRAVKAPADVALNMNIINLSEVYYGYIRDFGQAIADDYLSRILAYPVKVINVITDRVFREASRLKGVYNIPIADCYACATAMWAQSALVTSDHNDLEQIEQHEPLSFLWLPPKPKIQ